MLVDGVVIEKEKARVVFEAEARKTVEKPQVSIAESVVGNIFKTRIFPLPKQGTRTIRVSYVEELSIDQKKLASDSGAEAVYSLPLTFNKPIDKVSYRTCVEVTQAGVPNFSCDFRPQPEELPRLAVADDSGKLLSRKYACECLGEDGVSISSGVRVAIPAFKQTWMVDNDKGESYFALRHPPVEEPAGGATGARVDLSDASRALAALKTRIGILWDASWSRRDPTEQANQIELLRALFGSLGQTEVDLIVFRDRPEPAKTFAVQSGSSPQLMQHLSAIVYDGGSNLGALEISRGTQDTLAVIKFYILFTDGIHNIGAASSPSRFHAPVYSVSTSDTANHTMLRVRTRLFCCR